MDAFEAIYARRAVKHYDPEHELSEEELHKLIEAAMQSPTSFNIQNWRFVLVTRQESCGRQIRAAASDQAQVTDASLLIVMTADLKAWEKSPQRYWRKRAAGGRRGPDQLDGPVLSRAGAIAAR